MTKLDCTPALMAFVVEKRRPTDTTSTLMLILHDYVILGHRCCYKSCIDFCLFVVVVNPVLMYSPIFGLRFVLVSSVCFSKVLIYRI